MSGEKSGIVVIVGSNPLPNVITVQYDRSDEVVLVYSQQTSTVAKRLRRFYRDAGIATKDIVVRNAADSQQCRAVVTDAMSRYRLDYTGGTKVMSSSIYSEWYSRGGTPERASYVDDRSGLIRFDDGTTRPIELTLKLSDILRVHGLNLMRSRFAERGGPTFQDARKIASMYMAEPSKIQAVASMVGKKSEAPVNLEQYDLHLSRSALDRVLDPTLYKEWSSFLRGKWLELWVGGLLRESDKFEQEEVHIGVEVQIREHAFELDVVLLHNHRVYLMSCTTADIRSAKLKLFEAMIRSRQIGGSLARAAIVAPLVEKTTTDGRVIDQTVLLQKTAAEMWTSPNPPMIFGLKHMKEWAGTGGRPQFDSLYQWFET